MNIKIKFTILLFIFLKLVGEKEEFFKKVLFSQEIILFNSSIITFKKGIFLVLYSLYI